MGELEAAIRNHPEFNSISEKVSGDVTGILTSRGEKAVKSINDKLTDFSIELLRGLQSEDTEKIRRLVVEATLFLEAFNGYAGRVKREYPSSFGTFDDYYTIAVKWVYGIELP
ncbi:MAG TPA: hypothetical protein VJI46_02010 [Candidatus Nanoarchaeia archaeon]|nr:hypothetical protein [Candidatus Nanoarchaeia archaeon]